MTQPTPHRILVVTDHADASPELLAAIHKRAAEGPSHFRVLVPNPATAEVHPFHPERHDKAREAEEVLRLSLPALEQAAGGPVTASISVQHNPMDAIERVLEDEPISEVLLSTHEHVLPRRLHLDLEHRLRKMGLAVEIVPAISPAA